MEDELEEKFLHNFSNGFSQVPHNLFNVLPLIDLSERQSKVVWLMLRLVYGCQKKKWVALKYADLQTVGIVPSHAHKVMDELLNKQILVKNEKSGKYALNEDYLASKVTKEVIIRKRTLRLRELVKRHLQRPDTSSYQVGNEEVPEVVTEELPKEEVNSYQSRNVNPLPKREVLASDNQEIGQPKDSINIKEIYGKDNFTSDSVAAHDKHAPEKQVEIVKSVNPKDFIPSNKEEEEAFKAWQELDNYNPFSLTAIYLKAVKQGIPARTIKKFTVKIKNDPNLTRFNDRGKAFNDMAQTYIENTR